MLRELVISAVEDSSPFQRAAKACPRVRCCPESGLRLDFDDDESGVVERSGSGKGGDFSNDAVGDFAGGKITVLTESFGESFAAELGLGTIAGLRDTIGVKGEHIVRREIERLFFDAQVGRHAEEASGGA